LNGIVNYLKPPGITSHDAVMDIRRLLGERKVGHGGTLDPAAAGVLPVTVGRATRLFDFLLETDKEYVGEMLLGVATDTLDTCGKVLQRDCRIPPAGRIAERMAALTGELMQAPPMYSAVRVGGKRLYQLARKGETARVEPRRVTVRAFEFMEMTGRDRVRFRVVCSRGTYIRSLISDLGDALGCGACLSLLVRTRAGGFCIGDAHTFEQVREAFQSGRVEAFLVPPDRPLARYPALRFPKEAEAPLRNGALLPLAMAGADAASLPDGPVRLYCEEAFIGVGSVVCAPEGELVRVRRLLT
jgi:tRNA pseudouridine55 synthase